MPVFMGYSAANVADRCELSMQGVAKERCADRGACAPRGVSQAFSLLNSGFLHLLSFVVPGSRRSKMGEVEQNFRARNL